MNAVIEAQELRRSRAAEDRAEIGPGRLSRVLEARVPYVSSHGSIYLTTFLLGDGETLLSVAEPDTKALVLCNLVLNETETAATLRPEALAEIFYGDCSDEDVAWAAARLVPQASAPLGTPVRVTHERWGAIPRTYVHCTNDRAITLACQQEMVSRIGAGTVATLEASHSPFLSAPHDLAEVLVAAG